MSDQWKGSERREHPRIPLDGGVRGQIESAIDAPLVDLSLSGALIEVPQALPASARYDLKLPAEPDGSLELSAEIVRSYVHGFDREGPGKPAVRYRAAIRFLELDDAQKRGLESILEKGQKSSLRAELSS